MKKHLLLAAGALLVATAVSVFVYTNNEKNSMSDLFDANVEALARNEGGYACPGACLTWSGSIGGGGIDCLCNRYAGRCKTWC